MSRYVDLSVPIATGMPVYPGDPQVELSPTATVATHGCNVLGLRLGSHTGTHVDAPYHVGDDLPKLDELPLRRRGDTYPRLLEARPLEQPVRCLLGALPRDAREHRRERLLFGGQALGDRGFHVDVGVELLHGRPRHLLADLRDERRDRRPADPARHPRRSPGAAGRAPLALTAARRPRTTAGTPERARLCSGVPDVCVTP